MKKEIAKAEGSGRRNKDWVLLTLFVFADDMPKVVHVKQNSLDYDGAHPSRKHLTGVYGTNSRDAALFLASSWADAKGQSLYLLDVWAHLPNFHATRSQITREIIQDSHWMHTERLSSALKEEVHMKALKWIGSKHGQAAQAAAIDMQVPNIMLEYPDFAMKVLDEDPDLSMIVHPVRAAFDLSRPKMSFWAATVHLDRVSIVHQEIRHMPGIKVVF